MTPKRHHTFLSYVLLLLCVWLISCQSEKTTKKPFEGCRYGSPEAIFVPDLAGVKAHSFELKENESVETMTYGAGRNLTLVQSGCDHREQIFNIELLQAKAPTSDSALLQLAQEELMVLARVDPNLGPAFQGWVTALREKSTLFKRLEPLELQPGYYARIDRVQQGEKLLLQLIFSDQP